ncbi:AAA family ATPase [Streptomyces sp. NBC_01477]|uniref:AAA family ATPase n=1 Tax=Streptomyces sp. NBC_01477 TaxID=2976015 RepID=UPI002E2ED392|nr:AAA family ATPase [Streptomyces sp. NBC_01477]
MNRAAERADSVLTRMLSGAGDAAGGGILLLDGPWGCGRTTLLSRCVGRAVESGVRTLVAACSPAERDVPFGVLAQLVQGVKAGPESASVLGEVESAAQRVFSTTDAGEAETDLLSRRLYGVLLELAGQRPLVIAVDDIRHADLPSARCLSQLVRRLPATRMIVVLTDDRNVRTSSPPLRAEALRSPGLHRITVAPLDQETVGQLVVEHFGAGVDHDRRRWFYEATGGNPVLLRALTADYETAGDILAQGYGQAFLGCLHRTGPTPLAVVRGLAVLTDAATVPTLAHLAGADVESTGQALAAMTSAGLLRDGTFRHSAARLAVLDDLPAPTREDLHRRAARLLHGAGLPAPVVARHLVRAGRMPEPWVADVLLTGAFAEDEPSLAIELLHHTLEGRTEAGDRAKIRVRLLELESRIDPVAGSVRLGPLLAAARSGDLDVPARAVLVRQLLWRGRTDEAGELLSSLRGRTDSPVLRDLELWLAATFPALSRKTAAGGTGVRVEARSTAVLTELLGRGCGADVVAKAEKVLREPLSGRCTSGLGPSGLAALMTLVYADRLGAASFWCDQLLTRAESRGLPVVQASVLAAKAEILTRKGEFDEAATTARTALTLPAPGSWGAFVGLPLGALVLALTRTGRYEEASRYVGRTVPPAVFDTLAGLHHLYGRGHFLLATDRVQAALADFLRCGELLTGWALAGAAPVPWRTAAAEAWLRLGDRDQARRLVLDQVARAGADGDRARAQSLRLLAQTRPTKRRQKLLGEAVGLLEDAGDDFELARTLRDLGESHHALGDARRARRLARRARQLAKSCGAKPFLDELGAGCDDPGEPAQPDRIRSLTGSERRVASLAAAGYTNREIALKLYVTPSTVEQHLTHAFRKLSVKRREELPGELCADLLLRGSR